MLRAIVASEGSDQLTRSCSLIGAFDVRTKLYGFQSMNMTNRESSYKTEHMHRLSGVCWVQMPERHFSNDAIHIWGTLHYEPFRLTNLELTGHTEAFTNKR